MDLPSMVQRSGDTLIVRSVVSGNQLYTEQGQNHHNSAASSMSNIANLIASNSGNGSGNNNAGSNTPASQVSSSLLERHVERFRLQQLLQQQQQAAAAAVVNSVQQQQQQQQQQQAVISLDAKEEGLPQCKIKRNYSCNHCAYFTQNPRYHLTHLRDVHGEKIVINKCKLCLYASRHFQKLVRHMKMVHGCTDGIPSGHGQARGKRGMSREARKRRLEESVGVMGGQSLSVTVPDVPTLEQVKRELLLQEEKLQRDIQAFKQRQQEEQQREQQQRELEMVATSAYERQMQVLRDYERQSPAEPPTPSPTSGSATPPSNGEEPQNRLLKCSACEFTTLYRTQLRAHELAEHGKTKFFRCDKCSYVTHIKARFSKHVKYHSMPMIKCVTCDFRTPYKWNLDRHMKNHGGAGAFKCAACDFTADIKQSLTVHEMNHHVPPVGNAGSIWPRRQNKVGASEMCDDFLSDSAELEDQYNNNNVDDDLDAVEDVDEAMSGGEEQALHHHQHYGKRSKYDDEEEPTDLSQKGGCSSDTSSVGTTTPRAQRAMPNLIPISKGPKDILNLSKETNASRSSLTEIASMFFNEKQISEMLDKSDVPQLSPATTVASHNSSRSQLTRKSSFMDKLKTGAHQENLVCQCGHVAKCLSESIIHGKSCHASAVIIDDDDAGLHEDDADDRLEIDEDDDDHQSHSALNLSVTGSTRCQHCRHRCKSSTDLLHHLTQCVEAIRCANEMYDSNSGESGGERRPDSKSLQQQAAVQQQRVCIWNKAAKEIAAAACAAAVQQENSSKSLVKSPAGSQGTSNEENSYYGVETAPGYGEVTKKMTPEEEAANSSLKKVYKCPHCSFWASTASRFHVHIVGHLNKKPFECSLCSYRSNWRWDITKHIRLKTIRDPSHKTAKVLMNDETGRRNYTKYNKYITLMKVTEEDGDPKLMKSGEMTPNQVASLAFLKDYAKVGNVTGQDITLEPVLPSKPSALDDAHLADNLIRIPLLATMMNAAMAQQQHQQQQQKEHQSTMITPSVTISPVKRQNQGSGLQGKPSDDLITEVHQEGNEKRTVYRCRKCNFGHQNRDAVLAHVKIHYQDASYPKSSSAASSTSPLQVSVGGNPQFYMNKVFAAMCLSQSQGSPGSGSPGSSPAIPAGLLQRAIQEAQNLTPTPNDSALSGLALALAGGKPQANTTKASAASILEHGEQKASQNEASADSLTSPNTTTTNTSTKATTSTTKDTARSLQDLLTSPRSARNGNHHPSNANSSNSVVGNGLLRQDAVYVASSTATTTNNNTNNTTTPNASTPLPVTTTPTPISTATPSALSKSLAHQLGAGSSPSSSSSHNHSQRHACTPPHHLAAGLTHAHSSIATNTTATNNPSHSQNPNSFPLSSSSPLLSSSSSSSASASASSSASSVASISSAAGSASASSSSTTSSPPPPASSSYLAAMAQQQQQHQQQQQQAQALTPVAVQMPHPQTRFHSHSPGSPGLLTMADGDRRDPSPYRCGHCHQVSNWKHVIQRHCRLKHSGDIRIETLERGASVSASAPPIYRPLGAGASNESQSHIPSNPSTINTNLKSGNTNPNSAQLLMTTKQLEQLLHSPLSASAAAVVNAANTQQDLQAAAAYWAAACKAAVANGGNAEELLQLQQNDQIEITRLPSAAEHGHNHNNNNTKSKQQKCPVCPYISESKSQMNYHVSLHKPTQYECRLCTFVCAKKQHLSSHMRSVHQQQMGTAGGASSGGAAANSPSLGLDFSVALQLAAAAKQVQQLPASTPLSIDLSQLQLDAAASDAELNPQQLPPEYQYKLISYCPRCPARFAQKHNDERNAKQELEQHLLAHSDQDMDLDQSYVCAYCEYRTAEETMLQLHRAVHMSHYQEKCQQLYKNCKEDVEYPAPKLLQLTGPETIWVVDNELSLQLLQQTTGEGVTSSTGSYDNQNSLLKKQLESGGGQVGAIPRENNDDDSPQKGTEEAPEEDEERRSTSTPSTSASVATSDLAADASSDAGSMDMPQSASAPERCLHCPFETQRHEELQQHLQKHACVNPPPPNGQKCAHCDYNAKEESELEEHTALHFNASEKLKSVEFFTCYDKLEISVEQEPEDSVESKPQATEHNNNQDNVMNANVQQEEHTNSEAEQPGAAGEEATEEKPPTKKPSTKLILYKSDGNLSVKPPPSSSQEETAAASESLKSENISDRLRRRILRGSANHSEELPAQERPPTPDKMILVNAKTGKVISRK
ncbi:uncharacterized protein [Drosophila kikkawai]|uniref:Uncharacterized protein isoform X1 n=1 Tax=Drosophila kikkawai TaxID=30033 RepID=A0A6P4I9V9_DROKI|nr:uncharacterized protein LOC108077051 isoform X1 [Drosophila kikkawai]